MSVWDAQDKTFVVTGGASGMGVRYIELFLNQGAKSIAILDVAEELGKAVEEKYNETHPGQVVFIKCDMSKEEDITSAFNEAVEKFKQVDVIINNAGIMVDTPEMWRIATSVNFLGLVSLSLKGIEHMDKRRGGAGGTIVNIASTVAISRFPHLPIYGASKMAVVHFCRNMAMKPFETLTGIRVLCMCFGPTDTPLLHNLETRSWDPKVGQAFADLVKKMNVKYQSVDSAIAGVEKMIKEGEGASVWLSTLDKPAKDITPTFEQVLDLLEMEVFGVKR